MSNTAGMACEMHAASTAVNRSEPARRRLRAMQLYGAALAGVGVLAAGHDALAEEAGSVKSVEEVIVTGSRIVRDGYEAPTPVTVAVAEDLSKATPSSILKGLSELPQFAGSVTPEGARHITATSPSHGNLLSLHGIGPARTLVLLDGRRVPPTTFTGLVDTNVMPQLLIQRIEVVTAGASAAYGSDAVSGVVNFIIDDKFKGFKGQVQAGGSSRGDNGNYRIGLAAGQDLGDRAHFIVSADRYKTQGFKLQDRPSLNNLATNVGQFMNGQTPGTAANPFVLVNNSRFFLGTPGGIVQSGPFANNVFTTPGVFRPIDLGQPTGSAGITIGGDWTYVPTYNYQSAPLETSTAFGRLTYDLSDSVSAYIQVNAAQTEIRYRSTPEFLLAKQIFSGNPFIPAAMQQTLTATNTPAFVFSKMFVENGLNNIKDKVRYYNVVTGLKGRIGDYHWNIDYQRSESEYRVAFKDFSNTRVAAAYDAVRDPVSGAIVCGPTLSADPVVRARYAGCVPLNPFGVGAASKEALAYVSADNGYRTLSQLNDLSGSISGDLVDLWAGPLSVAVGAEYRTQNMKTTSLSDPRIPPDVTGLRGLTVTSPRLVQQQLGVAQGRYTVKEAFGEVSLPIAKNLALAQSVEINGAVRFTDYSTSGRVTTWKAGGLWALNDDVRFRLTRSRDIRAPTINDLFAQGASVQLPFLDPHTNISTSVPTTTSGNVALQPEKADTLSFGVVLQPNVMPGFSLSLDFYDTKIRDAIATPSGVDVARQCEDSNGTAAVCALIIRPLPFSDRSAANTPSKIFSSPVNIAALRTRGVDVEAAYRTQLASGNLNTRLFVTYVDSYKTQARAAAPFVEYAGWTEGNSIPKIAASLQAEYQTGEWRFFARERMIGKLKRGPVSVWALKPLPAVFYTDATVTYSMKVAGADSDVFVTVTNIFDKLGPYHQINLPGLYLDTLTGTYDPTGRAFTAGIRFKY